MALLQFITVEPKPWGRAEPQQYTTAVGLKETERTLHSSAGHIFAAVYRQNQASALISCYELTCWLKRRFLKKKKTKLLDFDELLWPLVVFLLSAGEAGRLRHESKRDQGEDFFRRCVLTLCCVTDCFSAFLHRMLISPMFALECIQCTQRRRRHLWCRVVSHQSYLCTTYRMSYFCGNKFTFIWRHRSGLMCCNILWVQYRHIFSCCVSFNRLKQSPSVNVRCQIYFWKNIRHWQNHTCFSLFIKIQDSQHLFSSSKIKVKNLWIYVGMWYNDEVS